MIPMAPDGKCRSCNAVIRWAVADSTGNRMPLDVHPVLDGNVVVVDWVTNQRDPKGLKIPVVAVGKKHLGRAVTPYRYVSHFATCPNAQRHKRDR